MDRTVSLSSIPGLGQDAKPWAQEHYRKAIYYIASKRGGVLRIPAEEIFNGSFDKYLVTVDQFYPGEIIAEYNNKKGNVLIAKFDPVDREYIFEIKEEKK